ncbi:hypothetical protein NliqN6_3660 [Naganishia liquefaciens]|uniref:DOC domain-containing protein n=1 Tax=Naganishia liquefaciens TaxID=104408 RepID=A0A8H3TUR2_9TREE|nr:hypothetical protein NliqN6_3660 [Naganishia liquefaciens]
MVFQAEPTDIGHLAKWAVSSHKYGFSVANLRDGRDDTFWQSEGPQPHWIDLAFPKRVMLSAIHIQCLHSQDDSYTPSKIAISAGTSTHELVEIRQYDLDKPDGWIPIPLRPITIDDPALAVPISTPENPTAGKIEVAGPPVPAFYLRVHIVQNHLNGKDTHVRGLRVFGLATASAVPLQQRVSLPVLISYSSANKMHDPRHPTSQTTAVTRKSSLVHGSSVVYSSVKGVAPPFSKLAAHVQKEAREDAAGVAREGSQADRGTPEHMVIHPPRKVPELASPSPPATEPQPPSPSSHPQHTSVNPDPLDDPAVQEAQRILEWGDDGLGEYTSLEMRMHRGIR